MGEITTIGLDIAKSVFHVHGVDAAACRLRRQLRRAELLRVFERLPRCLVGRPRRRWRGCG